MAEMLSLDVQVQSREKFPRGGLKMNLLPILRRLLIASPFAHSCSRCGLAGRAPPVLRVSEDKDVSDPGNEDSDAVWPFEAISFRVPALSRWHLIVSCMTSVSRSQGPGVRGHCTYYQLWLRAYCIKPPFALSKELLYRRNDGAGGPFPATPSPVGFSGFPGPGGSLLKGLRGPAEVTVAHSSPLSSRGLSWKGPPRICWSAEYSRITQAALRWWELGITVSWCLLPFRSPQLRE